MLPEITQEILEQIPKEVRLSKDDIAIIHKNKDLILNLTGEIVEMFYTIVYGHEATKQIFHKGERGAREKTLEDWIAKTVNGSFNTPYWEWQTYVGLIHIKRGVKNNMMITMIGAINQVIYKKAINDLPKDDAIALIGSWMKLAGILASLISEGFRLFQIHSLESVIGLKKALINNMTAPVIEKHIQENQKYRM